MSKYFGIFVLLSFFSIEVFSQTLLVNVYSGFTNPIHQIGVEFANGGSSGNSGTSGLIELNIDYGKKELIVEPYLGIGYKFQYNPFIDDIKQKNPVLSESGSYMDVGIKKTFVIGYADFRIYGGLGYQKDDYLLEYQENNIEHTIQVNGLKYEFGLQLNFKFVNNLDASFSWQYSIKNLATKRGSLNRLEYEFKGGGNYQAFYFGLSLDILNIL